MFQSPKRHVLLAVLVVINIGVGSFVACSGPSNSTHGSVKPFKVALLTPGPISDQSWNGSAYAGLMRIKDSIVGAKVSHIQTKTPAEFEENFRQYGAAGYSLVIGHGFEFQDAAARVGPEFPKTIYITTGGNTIGANVAAMSFSFDEPSYLAGIVAGLDDEVWNGRLHRRHRTAAREGRVRRIHGGRQERQSEE